MTSFSDRTASHAAGHALGFAAAVLLFCPKQGLRYSRVNLNGCMKSPLFCLD